ncbi:MAG: hypothetical protein L6Q71_06620 [Planctomycetes bacterium]|nr:hypothetical protein [Planctomycetota bacterium]NUQ35362.1 hypothetical protein [Planctomycetaceae bacterium]
MAKQRAHILVAALAGIAFSTGLASLGGCAGPDATWALRVNTSIAIAPPRNLSGRPLQAIEADIYTADSLRMSGALAPHNDKLNLLDAMRAALTVASEERGIAVSEKAGVTLHVALDAWDSSMLESDGTLSAGVTALLVDGSGNTLGQARVERSVKLLAGSGPVIGENRVIEGRYEALSMALARALLDELS